MITIIRWWIYKSKVIKLKLGLIQAAEQLFKELSENKEDIQKEFVSKFAELIHNDNKRNSGKTSA